MLSLFTRLFSKSSPEQSLKPKGDLTALKTFVIPEGGRVYNPLTFFDRGEKIDIELMVFLPRYGLFFAECLPWSYDELQHATIERSAPARKQMSTTHFERSEFKIHRKLEDVLSFDSTPLYRFLWLPNMEENEFDQLHESFHALLPKNQLLFKDETPDTVRTKFESLAAPFDTTLSGVRVIGALLPQLFILPYRKYANGALLSPRQSDFLLSPTNSKTLLRGWYGTGKSALLIRKALQTMLEYPEKKLLIIAPTLLASELLRNEFMALCEYGCLSPDLSKIHFIAASDISKDPKLFERSDMIVCDDADKVDPMWIDFWMKNLGSKTLLCSSIDSISGFDELMELSHSYNPSLSPKTISCAQAGLIPVLLSEIRKLCERTTYENIAVIVETASLLPELKEAIDEYFIINCCSIGDNFSLQSRSLDSIILSTAENMYGLQIPNVIIVKDENNETYPFVLSRASESATIISVKQSIDFNGDTDE